MFLHHLLGSGGVKVQTDGIVGHLISNCKFAKKYSEDQGANVRDPSRKPSGRSIIRQKPPVMQYVPKQGQYNDAQKKDAVSVLKDTDIATKSKRISASVSPVTMAVHKSRENQTSVQRQSNLEGNKTETLRE